MAMSAKFFVFISFDAVYVYSAELFPTVIRYDSCYNLLFHFGAKFRVSFFALPRKEPKDYAGYFFIIWLAPRAGKVKRILCSDWLPERARWAHLALSGFPALIPH